MKHCQMAGIQSRAFCPTASGSTGTSRHARNSSPSLRVTTSNSFIACARRCSFWGKKNIPTPYSRSLPSRMFSSSATLEKNLWLICSRMPTPSPVLPSASLPARCSSRSTMDSASSTVWWLLRPLMSTTAPMPQASCSNCGSYRPRVVFCSVKFSIVFPILFTCLLTGGLRHPPQLFIPCKKKKAPRKGIECLCGTPLFRYLILYRFLKNLQVTAAPNMLHTLRRFLCETPRAPAAVRGIQTKPHPPRMA